MDVLPTGEGLAVRGEEVRRARAEVRSWLRRIGGIDTAGEPSMQSSPRPS